MGREERLDGEVRAEGKVKEDIWAGGKGNGESFKSKTPLIKVDSYIVCYGTNEFNEGSSVNVEQKSGGFNLKILDLVSSQEKQSI